MNAPQTSPSGLDTQLIDLYGQLLLDKNLVFAIILAWAITHFIKQSPWIKTIKPVARRDFYIRFVAIIVGFCTVLFFKRSMLATEPDHVVNFGIMVAFTHPFLYKLMTLVLEKFMPSAADALKTK